MNPADFKSFHAHLYYPLSEVSSAKSFISKVKEEFDIPVGRVWDKPVGPHPVGSCQLTLSRENYETVTQWLDENRGHFDVFIHAVTGDDYIDHTEHVTWLGNSWDLDLSIFSK